MDTGSVGGKFPSASATFLKHRQPRSVCDIVPVNTVDLRLLLHPLPSTSHIPQYSPPILLECTDLVHSLLSTSHSLPPNFSLLIYRNHELFPSLVGSTSRFPYLSRNKAFRCSPFASRRPRTVATKYTSSTASFIADERLSTGSKHDQLLDSSRKRQRCPKT